MSSVSIEKTIRDETVVIGHVEESRGAIVLPVSHTVTDHETLEVGNPGFRILGLGVIDETINSQCKLRNVDTSIRFTREVQRVVLKSGEFVFKQVNESNQIIIS